MFALGLTLKALSMQNTHLRNHHTELKGGLGCYLCFHQTKSGILKFKAKFLSVSELRSYSGQP